MIKSFFLYSAWLSIWIWFYDFSLPFVVQFGTGVPTHIPEAAFSCLTASSIETAYYLLLAFGILLIHRWRFATYKRLIFTKNEFPATGNVKRKANINAFIWVISWTSISFIFQVLLATTAFMGDCHDDLAGCYCQHIQRPYLFIAYILSTFTGVFYIRSKAI